MSKQIHIGRLSPKEKLRREVERALIQINALSSEAEKLEGDGIERAAHHYHPAFYALNRAWHELRDAVAFLRK